MFVWNKLNSETWHKHIFWCELCCLWYDTKRNTVCFKNKYCSPIHVLVSIASAHFQHELYAAHVIQVGFRFFFLSIYSTATNIEIFFCLFILFCFKIVCKRHLNINIYVMPNAQTNWTVSSELIHFFPEMFFLFDLFCLLTSMRCIGAIQNRNI